MKVKKTFLNIAQYIPQVLVLFSVLTSNIFFPVVALAQEVNDLQSTNTQVDIPIDESEDILEDGGVSTSVFEEEEVYEPRFVFENGIYTVNSVVEGEEYVYPDNRDVRVRFSRVTEEGNLVIKRVELTQEEKELLNTSDDYGWDISSTMSNGSFRYDLTLPNSTESNDVEVKYTEDGKSYESIDSNLIVNEDVIEIQGLDHFTVFVVVDDGDTNFTASGWSNHPSGYTGDHKWTTSTPTGRTATWKYTGSNITNGAVYLSWTLWDNHATNAIYESSLFSDQEINQKEYNDQSSTGPNGSWSGWYQAASEIYISSDSTVTLSTESSTDGNLSADAVAFVDLEEAPEEVWVDDNYTEYNTGIHFWNYDAFDTIQEGISAVSAGGTVHVADGNYPETLDIASKSVNLEGSGVSSTIIDASGSTDYAIDVRADNVSIKDLKLIGSDNYGFKISHMANISLENILVVNSGKTGIDLHTINGGTLKNIEIKNTLGGFGLMLLDSQDITVEDVTTSENAWGGVSVHAINRNAENIEFIGDFDVSEVSPLLLEKDSPYDGEFVDIDIPEKFGYVIYGKETAHNYLQWLYKEDLDDAKDLVSSLLPLGIYTDLLLYDIEEENYWVIPGMLIQDAIDDATDGDTVFVNEGTYIVPEGIVINKENLTLEAIGEVIVRYSDDDTATSPYNLEGISVLEDMGNVTVEGFIVKGYETGIAQGMSQSTGTAFHVLNNTVYPGYRDGHSYMRNGIQVTGDGSEIIGNTVYGAPLTEDWAGTAIAVVNADNVLVQSNTVDGDYSGNVDIGISVLNYGISLVENVTIQNNTILSAGNGIRVSGQQSGEQIKGVSIIENDISECKRGINFQKIDVGDIQIENNTITENSQYGIRISSSATASGTVEINMNSIVGNTEYGLINFSTSSIVAENNWWGDSSGPHNSTTNPTGTGNAVSDNVEYRPWYKNEDMTNLTSPNAITKDATNIGLYDATLQGTNGDYVATGHSFWVSLSSFDTSSPNIPSNVYSTPDMGSIAANTSFSASLSSLTTNAVITGGVVSSMPAIKPNTTYYYVAWARVDGVWYPGEIKTFKTLPIPVPTLISPDDNAVVRGASLTNEWSPVSDATKYIYESYHDEKTQNLRWHEEFNTTSKTAYNVSDATFWWRVKAVDAAGNESDWSDLWKVTVDNTPPAKPTGLHRRNESGDTFECGATAQRQTMIPDWDDINTADDPSFSHFEYSSFNADGSQGRDEDVLYVSEFVNNWTAPTDGTYGYAVRSVDKAGNKSEWSVNGETLDGSCKITYDSVGPVVILTSPIDNYYTNQTTVPQTWTTTDTDVDYYEYRSCSNNPSEGECNEIYSITTENQSRSVSNNNISFYWQVRGIDNVGNIGEWSTPRKITIDTIVPTVNITSHEDNDIVNGTVTISGTIEDLNLYRYWFVITNSSGTKVAGPGTVYNSNKLVNTSFDWNTKNVLDGTYTIKLEARDLADNKDSNSIEWITVIVDNTPPTLPVLESPVDGVYINDNTPLMQWADSRDDTGVAGYYYRVYYNCADVNDPLTCSSVYPNQTGLWRTNSEYQAGTTNDGTYYWQVKAVDTLGNESNWSDLEKVVIDTQEPNAPEIKYPTSNSYFNSSPILNDWTEVDDSSGIAYYRIEYIYDDNHAFYNMPYRYETTTQRYHVPADWEEGGVKFRVQAIDMAGNEGTWSDWRHYYFDHTAPVVEITNPSENDVLSGTVDITGYVTDDNLSHYNIAIYNEGDDVHDFSLRIEENTEHTAEFTEKTLYTWNTTNGNFPDGVYQIRLAARDLAGNEKLGGDSEHVIEVTVDNTAPLTLLSSDPSGTYVNSPVLIEGTTTDIHGVDEVNLSYRDSDADPSDPWIDIITLDNTDNDSPFNWSHTWDPLVDGVYDIKVFGTDTLGNEEQSAYIYAITYDTTPPSITIFDIVGDMLDIKTEDVLSGTEKIEIKIDDGEWITYVSNVNLNDLLNNEPGTYTIYIKVTDKAGNITEDSITYTIPEPPAEEGEVLGETDDKSTGTTTTEDNVVYAQTPGTGSGTEITEEENEETIIEEEVLGEDILTCENPIQVKGYIYLDKNKNDLMDENEKGIAGISITITGIYKENKITIDTIETDEKGYYETKLCPDTYTLTIDKNDLPKNTEIEEVLSLEIKEDTTEPIQYNIPATDTRNFWQKYWYLILIAGALVITTVYLITTAKKKEQK